MARNLTAGARRSAAVFAALGDELRLRIVIKLSTGGPLSTARITDGETMTRQAITKHLDVLSEAGLVHDLRRGRERLWQLQPEPLGDARAYLELVSARWDDTLARLRAFVED